MRNGEEIWGLGDSPAGVEHAAGDAGDSGTSFNVRCRQRCPHCQLRVEVDLWRLGARGFCPGCGEQFRAYATEKFLRKLPPELQRVLVVCNHCDAEYLSPVEQLGRVAECAECGKDFRRRVRREHLDFRGNGHAHVACPGCGERYVIKRQKLGKTSRCKGCGESFTLGDANRPAPGAGLLDEPAHDRPPESARKPERHGSNGHSNGHKNGNGKAVADERAEKLHIVEADETLSIRLEPDEDEQALAARPIEAAAAPAAFDGDMISLDDASEDVNEGTSLIAVALEEASEDLAPAPPLEAVALEPDQGVTPQEREQLLAHDDAEEVVAALETAAMNAQVPDRAAVEHYEPAQDFIAAPPVPAQVALARVQSDDQPLIEPSPAGAGVQGLLGRVRSMLSTMRKPDAPAVPVPAVIDEPAAEDVAVADSAEAAAVPDTAAEQTLVISDITWPLSGDLGEDAPCPELTVESTTARGDEALLDADADDPATPRASAIDVEPVAAETAAATKVSEASEAPAVIDDSPLPPIIEQVTWPLGLEVDEAAAWWSLASGAHEQPTFAIFDHEAAAEAEAAAAAGNAESTLAITEVVFVDLPAAAADAPATDNLAKSAAAAKIGESLIARGAPESDIQEEPTPETPPAAATAPTPASVHINPGMEQQDETFGALADLAPALAVEPSPAEASALTESSIAAELMATDPIDSTQSDNQATGAIVPHAPVTAEAARAPEAEASVDEPMSVAPPAPAPPLPAFTRSVTCRGHTRPVFAIDLTQDGTHAISGGLDGVLRLWNVNSGECVREIPGGSAMIWRASLIDGARQALTTHEDAKVRLWDLESGQSMGEFACPTDDIQSAAFSRSGRLMLAGDTAGRLTLLELGRPSPRRFAAHEGRITAAMFLGENSAITAGEDNAVRVWDLSPLHCRAILKGHDKPARAVACDASGGRVISAGDDHTLRVWDVARGACERAIHASDKRINAVWLSGDGKIAASAGDDGTLRLWDADTGALLQQFSDHRLWVSCLTGGPGTATLISGGWDQSIHIYRAAAAE